MSQLFFVGQNHYHPINTAQDLTKLLFEWFRVLEKM